MLGYLPQGKVQERHEIIPVDAKKAKIEGNDA
jgi:hypothetical protein